MYGYGTGDQHRHEREIEEKKKREKEQERKAERVFLVTVTSDYNPETVAVFSEKRKALTYAKLIQKARPMVTAAVIRMKVDYMPHHDEYVEQLLDDFVIETLDEESA